MRQDGEEPFMFIVDVVAAMEVLDSRGRPTVAARVVLGAGEVGRTQVPSGASTGEHKAVERRDGDPSRYGGAGVLDVCQAIESEIAKTIRGRRFDSLASLDGALIELDGTPDKRRLGANALLAVSQAAAYALAAGAGQPLHAYLSRLIGVQPSLPVPHFNLINGGAHAANALRLQEFMVAPTGAPSMAEAVRCGAEVYAALRKLVVERYGTAGVGDEGGFAPDLSTPEEALDLLVDAIGVAGYRAGAEVELALDPAANGFYGQGDYDLGGAAVGAQGLIRRYQQLIDAYPIRSIEDGLAEQDRAGWQALTRAVGGMVQVVGDDLLVTDPERIHQAARERLATAALIKPNQAGTVTETLEALAAARAAGWGAMLSHRSGETTDTFCADLAVAAGVGQIKAGAPARGERVAKYNRLLEIAATSGHRLRYGLAV
jgi:enolase